MCSAAGDTRGEAAALSGLADTYRIQGNANRAIEVLGQAAVLSRHTDDRWLQARVSWYQGLAHLDKGEREHGLGLMQVLVDYEKDVGHLNARKDELELTRLKE